MSSTDDLTTSARIRTAAVTLFGRDGFARTTVRAIAAEAGVSPGLVIHHFGSKDGLREACDDWVMAVILEEKSVMALGGGLPSLQAYVAAHPEFGPVMDYLVAGLREGGAIAERIWERMVDVTARLLDTAIASGTMRAPEDRAATAALLAATSCGVMLLGPQVSRALGGRTLMEPPVYTRYTAAMTELYTHGVLTEEYAAEVRASLGLDPTSQKKTS